MNDYFITYQRHSYSYSNPNDCASKDKHETSPNIWMFENWIKYVVHNHCVDPNNINEMNGVILYNTPWQLATRYTRMKAFGNLFVWKTHNPWCSKHTTWVLHIFLYAFFGVARGVFELYGNITRYSKIKVWAFSYTYHAFKVWVNIMGW